MVYFKRTTVSKVTGGGGGGGGEGGGGVQHFPGEVQFYQEEGGGCNW